MILNGYVVIPGTTPGLLTGPLHEVLGLPVLHPKHGLGVISDPTSIESPCTFLQSGPHAQTNSWLRGGLAEVFLVLCDSAGHVFPAGTARAAGLADGFLPTSTSALEDARLLAKRVQALEDARLLAERVQTRWPAAGGEVTSPDAPRLLLYEGDMFPEREVPADQIGATLQGSKAPGAYIVVEIRGRAVGSIKWSSLKPPRSGAPPQWSYRTPTSGWMLVSDPESAYRRILAAHARERDHDETP